MPHQAGTEAFMDPDDETLYLAAQAVVINLAGHSDGEHPPPSWTLRFRMEPDLSVGCATRLAHDYLFVDETILWDTVARDAPELLDRLLADEAITAECFLRYKPST